MRKSICISKFGVSLLLLFFFTSISSLSSQVTIVDHTFETGNEGWTAAGEVGGASFILGSVPPAFFGGGNSSTVWSQTPFDNYGSSEGAHVTSPSFDLSNFTDVTLSLDVRYNTEGGFDGMTIFYSIDGGTSWSQLGSQGAGWYNSTGVDGPNDRYALILTDPDGWSGDNSAYETVSHMLASGTFNGQNDVIFRVYWGSDGSSTDDGVSWDNFKLEGTSLCTAPTATFTTDDTNCGSGNFGVTVSLTDMGDADAVIITDDQGNTYDNGGAGYVLSDFPVTVGSYIAGSSIVITIDDNDVTCPTMSGTLTDDCACAVMPTGTVSTGNLDCVTSMYDITVTVDNNGDGTSGLTDIMIDGGVVQADATDGQAYTFTVATGAHTIVLEAEGAGFSSCTQTYNTTLSCNGGDTCPDAVDITNDMAAGDLTVANVDGGSLVENFISCGNGDQIALCGANSGFTGSSYVRTDHTDLWYSVMPNGSDEVTVTISNLMGGNLMVLPYLGDGTCPTNNTTLENNIGNLSQSITNGNCPFFDADGSITFSGTPLTTASVVYLRVVAYAENGSGATNCETLTYATFDISTSVPQANDVCGDAISIDGVSAMGNLCAAGTESETNETGASCGSSQETADLWYEVTMDGADSDQFLEVDLTFTNAGDAVVVELYSNCFSSTFEECATVTSSGAGSTVKHTFDKVITAGGFGPTWYVRVTAAAGNAVCNFNIFGKRVAENNNCEVMQEPFPGFDIEGQTLTEMNFSFASPSGASPAMAGNDLWFQFDTNQETDAATGLITGSTTSNIIIYGDAGVEYTLMLYKGNTVSSNNCANLADDHLETLTVSPNGSSTTVQLSCLDELHLSTDGGYILRVIQTAGPIATNGGVRSETQPAGPYNNDCENIWDGSGPTILGADGEDASTSFNPYVILPGFSNYRSGDFENSTDCHSDITSAVCNGVDQQAILANEDRDMWYIITVPALSGACDLAMSEIITGVTFLYNAGSQTEDGVLYLYDGCDDTNLIGCSGVLDGAPSGAGDDQFNDEQSTWTVSGLTQGASYLLRVKPHDISNNSNNNEFDFDISWKTADPAPCNDDPVNAEGLGVGCFSYSSLETWSAQGATETAPVDGAPESDVWFSFTAPAANGGAYTTAKSWVSTFFENVSGHKLYLDLYNTTSTSPTTTTYETGSSVGDQGWGIFGNLDPGETYYLRLYHKELPTVNVQYKIAVNDGPGVEPGWSCGSNSQTMINQCASGCKDLREVFFKIDLPVDAPTDSYWAIEVTGMDQNLDFELRSQYNNGQTTYVVGTTGVDGALEGGAMDYDHPCSSVVLESEVTISNTTTGLTGCDGNDSLGDVDPTLTSQGSDGNNDVGSGVRRVYHDMNGPGSASMKDYYFVRVFIDPSDPRYNEWAEVKICDISFKGPYSTSALADAGGAPDRNCDPVTCAISNVMISDDNTCDGNDATFTVSFDVADGSGDYEVINTATNAVLGAVSGALTGTGLIVNVTVSGPLSGSTISVDVRDQANNICEGGLDQSVVLATCPNTTMAVDDYNQGLQDQNISGDVTVNDYDAQGHSQTVNTAPVTEPSMGSVVLSANGTYVYTPNAGFTGEDSFVYEICDDQSPAACDQATVYIEVIETPGLGNEAPIANNDIVTTEVNTTIMGLNLLSNDNDPDGDNLTIMTAPVADPTNGTVTINPDGTYTYIPNTDFTGMDQFEYQVCDDANPALCDNALVIITINLDNGNVTYATDDAGLGMINMDITGDLLANDFDPEGNGQIINTTPLTNPTNGAVTINTDGTYTYTPAMDYTGNDEFQYTICDDASPTPACDTATVHLTVLPGLPNTTYAVNDFNHTPMDSSVMGNVLVNDIDSEGDAQTVNTTPTTAPTNGTVILAADGSYTYTPTAGFTGSDSFMYEVCDATVCDIATVTINVLPAPGEGNNSVIANPDNAQTVSGVPVTGDMLSNDNDIDGDNLMVNTTPVSGPINGTLVIYPDGTYSYTPDPSYIGSDTFDYEVCDDGEPSTCATATVTIDVLPDTESNYTFTTDDSGVGLVGEDITGNALDNDFDPEGDNQNINTTPVSDATNGSVVIYPNGYYVYTPNPDFVGNDEFTYEVCDEGSPMECSEATVYLTVLAEKKNPEFTPQFDIDANTFVNGQTRDVIYTIDNIGEGDNEGQLVFAISLPGSSSFTVSTIAEIEAMTTADVNGGTTLNNDKWNFVAIGQQVFCQLKAGETISAGSNSIIGFKVTAIGTPSSTGTTTGFIQTSSAGDINRLNNFAQGSFVIN